MANYKEKEPVILPVEETQISEFTKIRTDPVSDRYFFAEISRYADEKRDRTVDVQKELGMVRDYAQEHGGLVSMRPFSSGISYLTYRVEQPQQH